MGDEQKKKLSDREQLDLAIRIVEELKGSTDDGNQIFFILNTVAGLSLRVTARVILE